MTIPFVSAIMQSVSDSGLAKPNLQRTELIQLQETPIYDTFTLKGKTGLLIIRITNDVTLKTQIERPNDISKISIFVFALLSTIVFHASVASTTPKMVKKDVKTNFSFAIAENGTKYKPSDILLLPPFENSKPIYLSNDGTYWVCFEIGNSSNKSIPKEIDLRLSPSSSSVSIDVDFDMLNVIIPIILST